MQIQVFPSEQLGSGKDVNEMIRQGANVMNITDPGYLSDFVPDIGVLNGPYLIKDPNDYDKLLASDWYKGIEKKLEAAGFKLVMANGFFGQRHLIADKPVRKPEDMAGMTVRVPPNTMWIETFKAMGARPTTVQWSEVYNALQQNVVAGAEAPLGSLWGSKLHETRKVISMTGHFTAFVMWPINAGYFRQAAGRRAEGPARGRPEGGRRDDAPDARPAEGLRRQVQGRRRDLRHDVDLAGVPEGDQQRLQRVPEVDAGPARHRDGRPAQVSRRVQSIYAALGLPPPTWRRVGDQFEEIVACLSLVVVVLVGWLGRDHALRHRAAGDLGQRGRDARLRLAGVLRRGGLLQVQLHPSIDMLVARLPRPLQTGVRWLNHVLVLAFVRVHDLVRHPLLDRCLDESEPGAAAAADLAVRAGRVLLRLMALRYVQVQRHRPAGPSTPIGKPMWADWIPGILMLVLFAIETPISFAIAISALSFFLIDDGRAAAHLRAEDGERDRLVSAARDAVLRAAPARS